MEGPAKGGSLTLGSMNEFSFCGLRRGRVRPAAVGGFKRPSRSCCCLLLVAARFFFGHRSIPPPAVNEAVLHKKKKAQSCEGRLLCVPEVAWAPASLSLVGRHAAADCALDAQGKEMAATF